MRGSWRWYLGVAMAACVGYFVLPVAWGTLAFLVIAESGVVAQGPAPPPGRARQCLAPPLRRARRGRSAAPAGPLGSADGAARQRRR
jgi:hypothetical protein